MVRQVHRPMTPKTMERYVIQPPSYSDARIHFEKYVRRVKPVTEQQFAHLRNYGAMYLSASEVDQIIERAIEQDDLYA